MTRQTPVVVGVGDYVNRSKKVEDALEPLELIIRAFKNALDDTGLSGSAASKLQSQIDSLDVVKTWVSMLHSFHTLAYGHDRHGHIPIYQVS
jgi:hypothetical protein